MTCGSCGTENPAGAKFCNNCAARLATLCPACSSSNVPSARFCNECGTALAGAGVPADISSPPAASQPPSLAPPRTAAPAQGPAAERRLVTVLFADLVGFTPYAEERDPEEVRELLTRYFDLAREVVGRYGGTIEKFIGDAVMAVWGAPVAREDDAERAVRAALELTDVVRALGPEARARVGVLTGEAAVTLGAVGQGMVAGDLVNTASRLQSVAAPGVALVGESTMRATSASIAYEPAGEQTLKGKAAPVPAWRALRVVAEVGGRGRAESLEAPFVGRGDELRLLKDLFHATGRESRARLVSVLGPAGIGKSRLAWEVEKYLDGVLEVVWWHRGRSPAYGEGLSFWALGEMVRGRCGLLETDDERTTRQKVAATLAEHVADVVERSWIEVSLLALLGVEARSAASQELFAAWRTFFERLAARGTVALVFEDLHWADTGTLDFIDHLLEWSKGSPFYVVTLARPELLERRPDWGAGKRNFTSLFLEPLSEPAMRELLAGLVPGLPESAAGAIIARADGIPLYAVETVRMLVGEGRLVEQDGFYVPAGDLTGLAIPDTLTALIAARLDALERGDRALLQDAAVLGQSFTPAGLAAISGLPVVELEPRLRGLARKELLTLQADPRSPEQGQYSFVQALIREVAYGTLARRDRKTRHLAAARWFEQLGSEELAGALAGHYLAAYQNAPEGPEADALAAQARVALVAAADRAVSLGAHEQATALFEEALSVTRDAADEAVLLERAGESARTAGQYERAAGLFERAVQGQRTAGDRVGTARATVGLARALAAGGHGDDARAMLESATVDFGELGDAPERLMMDVRLAGLISDIEPRQAIALLEGALEVAERADHAQIVALALSIKGGALADLGRRTEGLGAMEAARRLAEEHGLAQETIMAQGNYAAYAIIDDPRSALEATNGLLARARRMGMRGMVVQHTGNAAEISLYTGDWAQAQTDLEAVLADDLDPIDRMTLLALVLEYRAVLGDPTAPTLEVLTTLAAERPGRDSHLAIIDGQAWVAFMVGRLEAAAAAWRELAQMSGLNAPHALPRSARASLWRGDGQGARADLAALLATGVHGRAARAHRTTIEAGLAALESRVDEALAGYREAMRAWRDLGLRFLEALAAIDMIELLGTAEPEAAAAASRAREILQPLGARPFLERLDRASARPAEKAPTHPSVTAVPAPVTG